MSGNDRTKPVTIVIADDHAIVRDGLRRLLEAAGLKVLAEASDGIEATSQVRKLSPDILLLDLSMPEHPGLETLTQLHADGENISTRIIVLTADAKPEQITAALNLGARGLVMKASATQVLLTAIRTVIAGGYWVGLEQVPNLDRYLKSEMSKQQPSAKTFGLTRRELQIVSAVVSGRTNKETANRLGISEDTVKHHLSNIFDKTGVSTRLELAMFAVKHNLPLEDMD